jgi:outer membrane receptor protein involved in Fe transport
MSNKKTQYGQRKSLLTGASVLAAASAALTSTPALAQDGAEEEEAIVVTGTRLARQDFEAISPVTTVGAEQLELTATLTTESLLNELPQIIPGNTRTSNNSGGFDYATVDLRGLGPGRTLVLINGERVPVSSTGGAVDINTIPASLISRVEVVTGGASAVYGSDAMAGVVNFVLKDDYEGAEVTMTYGAEMETGNVGEFEINGLVGGNFANGRGNITTYASYYHREGILQSEYDYSRVSGAICYDGNIGSGASAYYICDSNAEITNTINNGGFGSVAAGGSGTPAWGTVYNSAGNPFNAAVLNVGASTAAQFGSYDHDCNPATPNIAYGAGSLNLSFDVNGNLEPTNTAGACAVPERAAGSSRYNYAPDNFLVIPAERIALTTNGHYDFENDVRLNFMINYSNSRSEVQLAPIPATGLTVTLTDNMQALIQADHPDLWDALQSRPTPLAPFTMDRRMNEVGTRNSFFENNSVFFISGLEGALGENWDWALSASYGQNSFNSRAINSTNATALRQGLAGCQNFVDGAGNDTPLGVTALPGCLPLDIFGEGTLTDEMVAFITVPTFTDVVIEESRVAGFVRGDLFELPAGPLAVVLGFEYRDTFAGQYNDNEQRTGNIFGFNAVQDQEGQIDVYELYTEAAVPLITEAPFAHYLGLEAGYRLSNYSSVGNVETYKIGGEWAPSEWLRFRGIFNVATRAPNVFELYQNGDQGFPAYVDPCRDTDADGIPNQNEDAITGNEVIVAQCTGDGVVYPGFAATNAQVEAFAFGNPNLSPEESESITYGVVFQPDWFPVGTLRASVDYYDIEITQVIAALGAQFFLNDCYQNGTVASCDRIVRLPTGQVDSVETTRSNQGSLATQGYDIQVEWSVPVGPGQLTINELYSILDDWTFNGNSFAGTTSAAIGGAFPDYKSVLSVTYNVGDWTLFGRWSYVPTMIGGTVGEETPEASYFDASARWAVTDNFTLTANVDNLFDEYPPQTIDGYFSQANTDPQVYRVLGRTLSVSGRYRF